MSKGKSSNVNKKNNNTTTKQTKNENNVKQELIVEESSYAFLRIIIAIILVAIIVVLAIKACKKDEKETDKKDKKVTTTTTKKEEIRTTTSYTYYKKAEPISDTNVATVEVAPASYSITDAVKEEEIVDTTSPVIVGVDENRAYSSIVISALDDVTSQENLIVTIDDEDYNFGDEYTKNGKHTVKVIDESGNESEKEFIIAKFVTSKEEYYSALEDEENEYIAFANDIETEDDLVVARDVKLTSKEDVILTFGITIEKDKNATIERVNINYATGKKIRNNGRLKIESSNITFNDNAIELGEDESILEIADSDLNASLDSDDVFTKDAVVINEGIKKTNIKFERSNVNLGSSKGTAILYKNENDESNLTINNSTITTEDEFSTGINLNKQKSSNVEISSSTISGFNPSISLSDEASDCIINVTNSNLSGEPSIIADENTNQIKIDEEANEEEVKEEIEDENKLNEENSENEVKNEISEENNEEEKEIEFEKLKLFGQKEEINKTPLLDKIEVIEEENDDALEDNDIENELLNENIEKKEIIEEFYDLKKLIETEI